MDWIVGVINYTPGLDVASTNGADAATSTVAAGAGVASALPVVTSDSVVTAI